MSTDPLEEILDAAQESGLLSPAKRQQVTRDFGERPSTFVEAAERLVANEVLTTHQVELLHQGRGGECVLATRYCILDKLGQGGMGEVYKARDTKLDRIVAIKIMARAHVHHTDAVARFQREVKALAKVSHPAIVQAYDADQDGDRQFLVMEYLEGKSLAQVLAEEGRLGATRAADYVYQAALGLQHAHDRGLVHRDLKPGNLFLTKERDVKILDLGLARFVQDQIGDPDVTREGAGLGTPDYMAPEQFHDARHADPRSDIYSLGCTLYHLIAGRPPFPGSSLSEKALAHETREPAPLLEFCPEAPAGLGMVVARALAKRPAERFQSARELAEALAPYVASSSPSLPLFHATASWQGSQLTIQLARKPRAGKRRWLWAGAACFALVVPALFLAWPWLFPAGQTPVDDQGGGQQVAVSDKSQEPKSVEPKPDDKAKADPKKEPVVVTIPNGLTVAQDGTGQFRTINDALEKVKPGMTIQVLDDATYSESLSLGSRARHAGITLTASSKAVLEPPTDTGIMIADVPNVTVRGFRLRVMNPKSKMIYARGAVPGLLLEGLEILPGAHTNHDSVRLESLAHKEGDTPAVVRACVFGRCQYAIAIIGFFDYDNASPCARIIIRDNLFTGANANAIKAGGAIRQIHIVGNRFTGTMTFGAVQLENLLEGAEDVLIANNTFFECAPAFRLWDDAVDGKNIQIRNNLLLGMANLDMVFLDSDNPSKPRGPGDGALLTKTWRLEHNWREVQKPTGKDFYSLAWIPLGAKDQRADKIDVLSRAPGDPNFLRPSKDSRLATDGAGGDLPAYVGAVPPDGAETWDWQWTWDALVQRRLTVSQDPKTGGRFRTIQEALEKLTTPNTTIRVLDAATYTEKLALRNRTTQTGLILEAPNRATLDVHKNANMGLLIFGVPRVQVRGFRFRAERDNVFGVGIGGHSPGAILEDLEFRGKGYDACAITVEGLVLKADDEPLVIRRCAIADINTGVQLFGKKLRNGDPFPVERVRVESCQFSNVQGGVFVAGKARDIALVGNTFWDCGETGVLIKDLLPDSDRILIAHNSFMNAQASIKINDPIPMKCNVTIQSNLILSERGPDLAFFGKDPKSIADWIIQHNWREITPPASPTPDWLLSPKDKIVKSIKVLSRTPGDKDFLRPPADSPLAQAAPTESGAFPSFIGALAPAGAEPWDWAVTWQKRFHAAQP